MGEPTHCWRVYYHVSYSESSVPHLLLASHGDGFLYLNTYPYQKNCYGLVFTDEIVKKRPRIVKECVKR